MTGSYNFGLVVLSIVVASLASYVAIDLASRVVAARETKASAYWLFGGALSMGTGIWSMHFIGMLAFELPIRISYDIPITLGSLLIAVVVSGFALKTVSSGALGRRRLLMAGLLMGLGIASMHYTGMLAMQMQPPIRYDALLFIVSILVAIGASIAALWIAFQLRSETILSGFWKKGGSALLMGAAITGMHYVGMAAANFAPDTICAVSPQQINIGWLAGAVGGFTFLFLTATLVVSMFDVSLAQRAVQHAENLRQINEFLAMLAHELRNPLAPIVNALKLLRGQPNKAHAELHGIIERQVGQLACIVDDLLDVSRITRGKIALNRELLKVNDIVARAVESCRPLTDARQHRVQLHLQDNELEVYADQTRLLQVMVNLVNNAAKYTPEGGLISVSAACEDGRAVIRVHDTGIGITAAMLPKIFDPFVQGEHPLHREDGGGLGIGLTVVKRLVEMHGGTVHAGSVGVGRGSEFTIHLPLATEGARASIPVRKRAAARRAPGRRVLIIDDNRDFADTQGMLLESRGHEVRTAYDGVSALDLAAKFLPDVVLLDIGLPDVDGYEIARRLRRARGFESLTLVAVSGYGQDEARRGHQDYGFDFHLVKPVETAELWKIFDAIPAR